MTTRSVAIAYDCLFPLTTGGGERQYRAFAEDLGARGLEVDYLTARQWTDNPPAADGFRISAVTDALRLYDDRGVRRTPAALAFAWGLFRALRRKRRQYDVIVVSALPVLNVFAARVALWRSGTSIVVDYLEVWHRRQWVEYAGALTGTIAWALQRLAIAMTPIATCHSKLSADRLRAEGLRREALISPGLISPRDQEPVPSDAASPPFALYAGRHIPDKRVESLPAAVAHARTDVPDLRLVILGDGPSSDAVRAEVARQPSGDQWISMPGFVSEVDLAELMSTAACLVNPSRREGYGLVVVEAAAYGTPAVLVAGEDNASTELVEDGVNGYVAPDASASELGDTISHTVLSGAKLRDTTRDWYRDAVSNRTISRTIDALLLQLETTPGPARFGLRKQKHQ